MKPIAAVLLLSATALSAQPSATPLQQAATLIEEARYDDASRLLAPLANSADPQVSYLRGRIALAQNHAEAAAALLEKAVAGNEHVAAYHFYLGSAYGQQAMEANVFHQAMLAKKTQAEYERAVALDPNSIDARLGLIDFYSIAPGFMGGSMEKALQQAAEVKKRDAWQGHRAAARVYLRDKKPDLARKEMQDSVREQPNSAKAHASFASFLAQNDKNFAAAWSELDTALKLDPTYMPTYARIGQVAALSGAQLARGEEALKTYLAYHPKSGEPDLASAHYTLGTIYEKQGKKAEARASYLAAARLAPASKAVQEALKRVS